MFYLLYFLGKPGKKFFVLIAVPLRRGPEKRYYDLISLLAGEGGKDLPSRKTNFISYFFPTAIKLEGGLRVIKQKKKKKKLRLPLEEFKIKTKEKKKKRVLKNVLPFLFRGGNKGDLKKKKKKKLFCGFP